MITQEAFDIVSQKRQEQDAQSAADRKFAEESQQRLIGKDSIILGIQALVDYLEYKGDGVTVKNQLKSIATPDVEKVVEAVKVLDTTVKGRKDVDLSPVVKALKEMEVQLSTLPRVFPEQKEQREDVKVTNLSEIDTKSIVDAIKKLDLKVDVKAPVVKVDAPKVNVEAQDLEPIKQGLQSVVEAVLGIKWPNIPETDLKGVEKRLDTSNELLGKIVKKPVGGGGGGGMVSFKDSVTGQSVQATLDADGNVPVSGTVATTSPSYATKIDTTSTANTIYIGNAAIGSSGASAVWQVKKLNTASIALDKTWAAGSDAFTNVWDNRSSLSYS